MCQLAFSQSGKVGINTNTPAATLHVQGGDVLFNGLQSLPAMAANPPASGPGTRLMWYLDKAAFRSGQVSGTQWDKDSIGILSFATGYNAKALGYNSISMGYESRASGVASFSLGNYTNARGYSSFAIGNGSYAYDTAWYSLSVGTYNITGGDYSMAIGTSNYSPGDYAIALGYSNNASGLNAMALGNSNYATGLQSFALGNNNTASGYASFSGGSGGSATGEFSIKLGNSALAEGARSIALGAFSVARGKYASTIGLGTKSNGYSGMVAGMYNDTLVAAQTTVTNTTPLFIVGNGDFGGSVSNAFVVRKDGHVGIGNINPLYGLHVAATSPSDGGWMQGIVVENTAPLATAGEAAISFRNAALPTGKQWTLGINNGSPSFAYSYSSGFNVSGTKMVLDTTGNLGLGTTSPTFRVHIVNSDNGGGGWTQGLNIQNVSPDTVPGEVAVSFRNNALPVNKYWMVGINEGAAGLSFNFGTQLVGGFTRMYIDTTGKVGVGTIAPGFLLEVDGTAGKPGGGAWSAASDRRLKKDIAPYTDGLESIMQIEPITYHYNELSGYDATPEYVGVIAQDLQKIAPYMVSTSDKKMADGSSGYLQVDNSAMTYMLINAVKEQQQQIDNLDQELSALLAQLNAVDVKKN